MTDLEKALAEYDDQKGGVWYFPPWVDSLADAARRFANLTSDETKMWLCREGEKVHDWAFGVHNEPHCWFNGPTDHNSECGEYFVLRAVEEGTQ